MKYRVVLTHAARQQLLESALWWSEHRSTEQALAWLDGFETAISRLGRDADQQPLARESSEFSFSLHNMLYGVGRRWTHRAVFRINGDVVEILAIRHLAQDDLLPGDV